MIKVLTPSMPTADELLPYLRHMDESRVYVNGGPMVRELEQRIGEHVGNPARVVSNGTVALELALRAMDLPPGAGVLVPAATFVGSGQAIVNAGLTPVIADVHPDTWQLDAPDAARIVANVPQIKAVMPVATYGAPVPMEPWENFTYDTGLPVLVDAAGALPSQQSSPIPEIVLSFSLHATKAIGCGEGGAIVTSDRTLLDRVESLANFGPGGTNSKMSEYHAAVGLASMQMDRTGWQNRLAVEYGEHLPQGLSFELPNALDATLCPVLLPEGRDAEQVRTALLARGIETRRWYEPFLDERPEFAKCPRQPHLPVTDELRRRCLGLPWHAFLTPDDVRAVCASLAEVIGFKE